jgi:CRISPR-associated endonuclease Csn1
MKTILGLDLGVTSIGWAYINLADNNDTQPSEIIHLGARVIPLSSDENDEFTRGNAQTHNAERRDKRSARRNLQRYGLRKTLLTEQLKKVSMFPSEELFKLNSLELYGLRSRAISEQISLQELGRLLYLFNQKRGYKSNRKANNEEEQEKPTEQANEHDADQSNSKTGKPKVKGYLDLIADREQILQLEKITIGQFFFRQIQAKPHFRIKENIFTRASYIAEFDKIWETQQVFYPQVLTPSLCQTIRDRIIYYQRPLKSQKGLVSECRFEKHHKVAPKSSPLFQVFKVWQELNNIEIISYKGIKGKETDPRFNQYGRRELDFKEKQNLFSELSFKDKLTKRDLLKILGYKAGFNEYGLNIEKDIEGNRTAASFVKVFTKLNIDRKDLLAFELTSENIGQELVDSSTGEIIPVQRIKCDFEGQDFFTLWHAIYSIEESQVLIKLLVDKYAFTPDQATAISNLDFHKQGYGSLSTRAIRKVLPFLLKGMKYHEACLNAGYRHSDYKTTEENLARQLEDRLEILKKGSLRNPAVEKILNQTINLVNDVIEQYGRPDEIRVELARELKQNAEERKNAYKRITALDKRHKEIDERLRKELGFIRVSRKDIERYKLWEEFGGISPYDPSKAIALSDLFGGGYDVEHVLPKSRIFDDSFGNKTICPRTLNSGLHAKNQMTAFDFMKFRGEQAFNDFVEFVTMAYKNGKISRSKFERLMMPEEKIPDDFIERQLVETRYISKEVVKILTTVCRDVKSTTGSITDYQRHLWGYDLITQRLNWDKYDKAGKTTIEKDKNGNARYLIQNWNKRDDHRHHAVDALVIASTRQSTIQRLNNLNQIVKTKNGQSPQDALKASDLMGVEDYVKKVCPFPEQQVLDAVGKVLISLKAGKRVAIQNRNPYKYKKGDKPQQTSLTPRGYLHKEFTYGKINIYEKVKLSTFFNRLPDIAFEGVKEVLVNHLSANSNNPKIAFSAKGLKILLNTVENKPLHGLAIKEDIITVICFRPEYVRRYPLSSGFKSKDVEFIVDERIKAIVRQRIEEFGEKDAFKNLDTLPVWLNQVKGICIRNVRMFTGLDGLIPLHKSKDGKTFASKDDPSGHDVDFVSTRNNHHIAIYRDPEGKVCDNAVTFWDALKRKGMGLPIIIKNPKSVWDYILSKDIVENDLIEGLPKDNWEFITSVQQNEMFVFGIDLPTLTQAVSQGNLALISQHLFRVQKMSKQSTGSVDIVFRHHLETSVDDKKDGGELISRDLGKSIRIKSLGKLTGIKVKIDRLGRVVKIGE